MSSFVARNRPLPVRLALAGAFFTACTFLFLCSGIISTPSDSARLSFRGSSTLHSKKDVYATFMASRVEDPRKEDNYYNATRMLVYQLLYDETTRDDKDVIVMTTKRTPEWQLEQLQKDGAIIHRVEDVPALEGTIDIYIDVWTKLRFWELTQYRRIMFIDADMLLTRPLRYLWDHECAQPLQFSEPGSYNISDAELEFDGDFIATKGWGETHVFSAAWDRYFENGDYLNSGFFILTPSLRMFDRFMKIMPYPDLYGGVHWPEQNLLNYAYRLDGPLPWCRLPEDVTIMNGGLDELKGGVAALHTKFWHLNDGEMGRFGWKIYGRMEGFYAHKYNYT